VTVPPKLNRPQLDSSRVIVPVFPEFFGVIDRAQITQRTEWLICIAVSPPCFNLLAGIRQRNKDLCVQAFVAQSAVKTFNVGIVHWFARPYEVELDILLVGVSVERLGDKLAAIVDCDGFWQAGYFCRLLQGVDNTRPAKRKINLLRSVDKFNAALAGFRATQ
jgi:hypothetical protein